MSENSWEKFQSTLATRETCSRDCEYYESCPLMPLSKEKGVFSCVARGLSISEKRKFMNFFMRGEDGIRHEIMGIMFNLTKLLDMEDLRDVKTYMDMLLRVHRELYSNKKPEEKPMKPMTIKVTGTKGKKVEKTEENDDFLNRDEESLLNSPNLEDILSGRPDRESSSGTT